MSLRLWSVTIGCWFEKRRGYDSVWRTFEVEAENSQNAKAIAIDFADSTAAGNKKWTRFEYIKSHSMEYPKFPREVKP